jgi:hypothetical protein
MRFKVEVEFEVTDTAGNIPADEMNKAIFKTIEDSFLGRSEVSLSKISVTTVEKEGIPS